MVDELSRVGGKVDLTVYGPDKAADLQEYLLALNPALRGPIKQLLDWKIFDCVASPENLPKNCYETAAFVKGLDYLIRRQVQEESVGPIMAEPADVHALFSAGGYLMVTEFFPFRIEKDLVKQVEVFARADPAFIPKTLKNGDIILFGGRSVDLHGAAFDRYVHAMVYLGEYRGEHYVFEKMNAQCGPGSPYQIISLEEIFKQQIGNSAVYKNVLTDRVFVLRRF